MKTLLVRLKGSSMFRAGGVKGDRDVEKTVRSDTIFSAIIDKSFMLYDDETSYSLADSLRVSSMIYEKEGELYVFAPKYLKINSTSDQSDIKNMKKADFIPLSRLKDWIEGKGDWNLEKSVKTFTRPRVGIDRVHSSTNLYYIRALYFEGTPCFIAQIDEDLENIFKSSVRLLGDEGLGGDRTYGMGLFEPEFSELSDLPRWLILDGEAEFWITMSLYRPDERELEDKEISPGNSWYKLTEKGGWINSVGLRKPRVTYFEEGSTFKFKPNGENRTLEIFGNPFLIQGKPVSLGVMLNEK